MVEDLRHKGDFHIHSKYSYDSNTEPRAILERAVGLGLDMLSITDHESMEGSLEALKLAPEYGIEVIAGMEIASDIGDIIGLGLKEEIQARSWEEVIREIRGQGGVVILPHPFRGHKKVDELAASVDIIEVFNGHDTPEKAARSAELARAHGKPGIAGSDAHVLSEVGNAVNIFDDLSSFEKSYLTKSANRFELMSSRLIRDVKKRKIHRVPLDMALFFR